MGGFCTKPVANDDGESSYEAAPKPTPEIAPEAAPEAVREGASRCEQCGASEDLSPDIHGSIFCAQCWESWHKATAAAYDATAAAYDVAAVSRAAAPRAAEATTASAAMAGAVLAGVGDNSNKTVIAAAVTRHNATVAKVKEAAEKAARAEQDAVARQTAKAAHAAAMRSEREREALELVAKEVATKAQKEATARQAAEDAAATAEKAQRAAEASANAVCAHCGCGLREAPPGCDGAVEAITYEVVAFASGELCHALCQEAFRNARIAKCCDVCSKPIEAKFVALKSGVRMHEACFEAKMGRCHHCCSILTGPVAKVTLPGVGDGTLTQVRVHVACVPLLQAAVMQKQQRQEQQQQQQQDAQSFKNATGPAAQALARAEEAAALRKQHRKTRIL